MNNSLIRTIYLYVFALVGLILLIIGSIQLVDLGLKVFIFKKAEKSYFKTLPPVILSRPGEELTANDLEKLAMACKENNAFDEKQKIMISNWLTDYQNWKSSQLDELERKSIKRQKTASRALSFILIGLPIYLYHWRIIKKETK